MIPEHQRARRTFNLTLAGLISTSIVIVILILGGH